MAFKNREARRVYRNFVKASINREDSIGVTKKEIVQAINDLKDQFDIARPEFNKAISKTVRQSLTARQKAFLLSCVIEEDFKLSNV